MNFPSDCPCKGCDERHKACWDKCEKYTAWKMDREEMLAKDRLSRDAYTDHDSQPYWKKHYKDSKRGQM